MRQVNPTLASTTHDDIEALVQMRIDAMRESLERIGRFEPRRARDRFVSSFDSALCKLIVVDGVSVGPRPITCCSSISMFYRNTRAKVLVRQYSRRFSRTRTPSRFRSDWERFAIVTRTVSINDTGF